MKVSEKIEALRRLMRQQNVQAYIVPSDDYHGSEYVGEYFKERRFMSGFTGSAGTVVVTEKEAMLWTDGRYFLQAEEQLAGTPIKLMKSRQPGVPTIEEYLGENLSEGARIGFDGRTMTGCFAQQLAEKTAAKHMEFVDCDDLVGQIWTDRPPISKEPVWELSKEYAGLSGQEKLARVRTEMEKQGTDILVVSALDEIAWLLNLRGGDVAHTPVFLSYMILTGDTATLCLHKEILHETLRGKLKDEGITLAAYDSFYDKLKNLPADAVIRYDSDSANYRLVNSLPADAKKEDAPSPIILMKAVKTPQEMENMRIAHVKDGVAVSRFIYWLKTHVGREQITELSAADKLHELRAQMDGFIDLSFDPILAYGPHGAVVHYEPTPESDIPMEPKSFCLADTGGHYMEGTTDITRTIVLGPLTEEEKKAFTLVLIGHLNLAAAHFLSGVCGCNLDYLAREPLWAHHMDYDHGTGHGVGYLLSVHEGPQSIHWSVGNARRLTPLEEGMIVSDEPGFYEAGKFGIRHENMVMCRNGEKNDYGQFLYFETLTMVPFDKEGLDLSLMSELDIARLNAYHGKVYEALSPYMDGEELAWLSSATSPVIRENK